MAQLQSFITSNLTVRKETIYCINAWWVVRKDYVFDLIHSVFNLKLQTQI